MAREPQALTQHRFHILVALAGGDLHGSAIVRDVLDQTDGALRLWPVTLYGTLDALAEEGLIEELRGEERPDASERRRYYRITESGRSSLAAEAGRLAGFAVTARSRLESA